MKHVEQALYTREGALKDCRDDI